ncbi:uncharacterized protein B0J16DRAFT_315310 [Fusarium flagelliforme]|nr:uncharacterized protein B0J16DRAFT_315310 [Fusarium flagelliforme]KAH7199023.1 hypothetical protein B0J16DRAFT_315310 [Fusarium flagelliforme]
MPAATGEIKSVGDGSKFVATFVIDDVQFHLQGDLNPPVPSFASRAAILDYNSQGQLSGNGEYQGELSPYDVTFNFASGVKIFGPLNEPGEPGSISGSGKWEVK